MGGRRGPWHGLLFDWHSRVLFLDCSKPKAIKSLEMSRTTRPTTRRNIAYEYLQKEKKEKKACQRVMYPTRFCLILTYFYFNIGDLIYSIKRKANSIFFSFQITASYISGNVGFFAFRNPPNASILNPRSPVKNTSTCHTKGRC